MSQDMGAAILYQLQQLYINSGAISVLNASQYLTVPGVSACSVDQQHISSSIFTKPCVSACSVGQQNISPHFATVPNVGNIASIALQYISPTANVGITSVGNTPCNIYSMHNSSISMANIPYLFSY